NNMARLAFCDYHNMIAILEKYEHNQDFHQIVDFIEASHIRIETTEEGTKILATVDGKFRTISESSIRRNLKLNDEAGISSLPDAELFENLTLMGYNISPNQKFTFPKGQYTKRARIAQSSVLPPVTDEPVSPFRDDSQGEACLTVTGLVARQDRATITKTSTVPSDSTPRVTSLAADEGTQELEIINLKARVKLLEDKEGGGIAQSRDDAPIKGRSLDEGDEAAEKGSNDTEEMVNVLTSLDATTILSSRVAEVPTSSGSIPTAGPPAIEVPTGSDVVPIASPIFITATESTPYTRRKGKEKMVDSDTPKKKKLQEQIDIARDTEIARIHAEGELQMMIDGLDRNNETVAKYLQEYHQFATELPIGRRIELISWKARHFKRMTLEEIKEKFDPVWKQKQDFIPIGSKEESERFKRKGLSLEQDISKKLKTSKEVPEEKLKEMIELIPVKEVYVEALQVKHPIIDWEIHTEGEKSYWKIIRLGRSTTSYQFFVDLLKHFDREDLNQLWALLKETLNIRPAVNDKEKELWMELKRLYKPDVEDQLEEVPLAEQLPTANKDKFLLLIQSDVTAEELCTAAEVN
nr:hypothetical protein [Tanacetum cinerariifolium]